VNGDSLEEAMTKLHDSATILACQLALALRDPRPWLIVALFGFGLAAHGLVTGRATSIVVGLAAGLVYTTGAVIFLRSDRPLS